MLYIPYIFAPYPHGIPHNGIHPLTRLHHGGHISHIWIHPLNRVHHVSHNTLIYIHLSVGYTRWPNVYTGRFGNTHVMARYVSLYFDTPVFRRVTPRSRYLYTLELSIDTVHPCHWTAQVRVASPHTGSLQVILRYSHVPCFQTIPIQTVTLAGLFSE